MKLTAKIKRKADPVAKLLRKINRAKKKGNVIIIDPMGDISVLSRLMRLSNKRKDFVALRTWESCTYNPFEMASEESLKAMADIMVKLIPELYVSKEN